jgi:transcriptional regulator with XRE-family HTH domain
VERGLSGVGIEALLQIAEVLQVDAPELLRRIEAELKRGPKPPEKIIGRPRKTPKKEKTPEPGNAGQRRKKAAK